MKVLVTGGAGYIGSFMTRTLLSKGHEVFVIDSLERGDKNVIDREAVFVKGNILEKDFLDNFFLSNKIDAVMHFAGYISMEESVVKPYLYFRNNSLGSLNIIESAISQGVDKIIFSSTAGVYGNPERIPIPENHPINPTNPYGESKLIVEKMLSWYQENKNMNFVSLRYFNAAGASLKADMGENHEPETHIIPLAIKAALNNEDFYLFGTDYETADGTCVRDYIHVLDLAEAHILALKKLEKDRGGFFYNVGTGAGFTNRQVIDMIRKLGGKDFRIIERERRPGDANILVADSTKIRKELNFNPKYSDLKTIVETALKWHIKNKK